MYSQSFEKLWNSRRKEWHPVSDNKKRAFYQYERVRGITTDQMIFCLQKQYQNREELKKNNQFAPMLPALERWLRDSGWENELGKIEKAVGGHPSFGLYKKVDKGPLIPPNEIKRRLAKMREELGL